MNITAADAIAVIILLTILIAVGVALETMKQIDSQLMMRNYEGFLKGRRQQR